MPSQLGSCAIVPTPSRGWLSLKPTQHLLFRQHALLRRESGRPWFNVERVCSRNASVSHIYQRDHYQCVYCRKDLRDASDLTVEHLIPKSRFLFLGIANQDANRATCCLECNRLKRDWAPALGASAWRSRMSFLAAAGDEIAYRREQQRG